MLIIVMHNRRDYLEYLVSLTKKEDITDTTIIERKSIGSSLVGYGGSFVFSKGNLSGAYDRAFITVVKGEEEAKHLLDLIENDATFKAT